MGEIVVGVDGSAGATAALQWAAREAGLRRWTVTAVLAWGFLDQQYPATLLGQQLGPRHSDHELQAALDAAVAIALGVDAAQGVRREVECDLAAAALAQRSKTADLLVVGARGLEGFRSLLLGSVSDQCTQLAACPVVVVHATRLDSRLQELAHESPETHKERIVVGIDGSPTSRQALRWALAEARLRDARLDIVHAWQLPVLASATTLQAVADQLKDNARQRFDAALEHEDTEGVREIRRLLLCGSPAGAILEAAQGADLIAVGTRGTGEMYGLLVGSVSRQVVHHAPCPVVVVPPRRHRGDGEPAGPQPEDLAL